MVSSWTGRRLETAMRANRKEGCAGSSTFPSNASIRRLLLLVVSIVYYLVLEYYFGLEKEYITKYMDIISPLLHYFLPPLCLVFYLFL